MHGHVAVNGTSAHTDCSVCVIRPMPNLSTRFDTILRTLTLDGVCLSDVVLLLQINGCQHLHSGSAVFYCIVVWTCRARIT